MNMSLPRSVFLASIFGIGLLLQGCGVIFMSRIQEGVHIDPQDDSTEVILEGRSLGYGRVKADISRYDDVDHSVELRRKGYKSEHHIIFPEKKRIGEIAALDFGIPIGALGIVALTSDFGNFDDEPVTESLALVGLGGMFGTAPFLSDAYNEDLWIYRKRYSYDSPDKRIPPAENVQKEVIVGMTHFSIPEERPVLKYFEEKKNFVEGKDPKEVFYGNEMDDRNSRASASIGDSLNQILDRKAYVDLDRFGDGSTDEMTLNYYNTLKLSPTINEMVFHYFKQADHYFVNMDVAWSLVNHQLDTLHKDTVAVKTGEFKGLKGMKEKSVQGWAPSELNEQALLDGVYASLIQVLQNEEVRKTMKRDEMAEAEKERKQWDVISIPTVRSREEKVGKNITSVLTLKRKIGHGSGCIVSPDGYLVTNAHVVRQKDTIQVIFNDQTRSKARVIRRSSVSDLALLKMDTTGLRPLRIAEGSHVPIGKKAYSIGTPKNLDLGQSLTKGIISGKREFNELSYIQTDVSMNPGNSGGALLNEEGELIGITNAKLKGEDVEGIGFAIPLSAVKKYLKLELK